MREKSLSKVFRDSLKLINSPEKWGKHRRYYDRAPSTFCAAEAIEESTMPFDHRPTRRKCFQLLRSVAATDDIVHWNDEPDRIYEDVVKAFRHCLAITKELE